MHSVSIRAAGPGDVAFLVAQRRAMSLDLGGVDGPRMDTALAAAGEHLAVALAGGTYHAWIAEGDGQAIGSAGVETVTWIPGYSDPRAVRAWVHNLYVDPAHRRQGVARRLMEVIVDWCRASGFRTVYLHASDAGRPLYEYLGFQPGTEMQFRL